MKKFGYDGVFAPKANSPSCSFGYFSDGVALFWRPSKFRPYSVSSSDEAITIAHTPSPMVVASLEHIESKRISVVGVTHLKAKPGNVNEERRKDQIDSVLTHMNNVCFQYIYNTRVCDVFI